jgi:hypothetical protein
MITLPEAAKLTQDVLLKGIIEEIYKESPILSRLPFKDVSSSGLLYNRENELPTVEFVAPDEDWATSEATFTQRRATLCILGGDADVPNFVQDTYSNINDQMAIQIEKKTKAMKHTFEDKFINGDSSTNPKEFDGLIKLYDSSNRTVAGDASKWNSGTAHQDVLGNMDELIDLCLPKPDMILMDRPTRRQLNASMRQSGSLVKVDQDEFGNFVTMYNEIPIFVNDFMGGATLTAASYVFALRMGEDGVCGLQHGGIATEYFDKLEKKDARRVRIKWYVSLVLFSTLACSAIDFS